MTGFATRIVETQWGVVQWQARSLNHRGLDLSVRVPERFAPLEAECRKLLSTGFSRGRIDITLRFDDSAAQSDLQEVDPKALDNVLRHVHSVQELAPDSSPMSARDLLSWPGVLKSATQENTRLDETVMAAFEELLTELKGDRLREGGQIRMLLNGKIGELSRYQDQMVEMVEAAVQAERERLESRLQALEFDVDPERVAQEIAIALMKGDVSEEVERFRLHAVELERVLLQEEVAGKRLGFILQELSREANTISAKCAYQPLGALMIDMKVVLEQIREEIQNIV
ncbi:MAG: YicC family protein [Acidiferrobacterales bacterium]|nr:YicC family protein [Acidiferrobacterales bacterium]